MNKVFLPHIKKRTSATTGDLFFVVALSKLETINLPALMMERIHNVITIKHDKHGLVYWYLLNYLFY